MIKSNQELINAAKALKPHDPLNLVCWDQIEATASGYAGVIERVSFSLDDWSDIGGGNYMPKRDLIDKIRAAGGVHGSESVECKAIFEDIDYNRLYCVFDAQQPASGKCKVGYEVSKSGFVLMPNGGRRESGSITQVFNVWDRLKTQFFANEELITDYYTNPSIETGKNGQKIIKYVDDWGKPKTHYIKYDTKAKRQLLFDREMMHAQRKAETKALNAVARVLLGLKTGYTKTELANGVLYISRIEKIGDHVETVTTSPAAIAADIAAEQAPAAEQEKKLIKDSENTPAPTPIQPAPEPEPEVKMSNVEIMTYAFGEYDRIVSDQKIKQTISAVLSWLLSPVDHEADAVNWTRAVDILKNIDKTLPTDKQIKIPF